MLVGNCVRAIPCILMKAKNDCNLLESRARKVISRKRVQIIVMLVYLEKTLNFVLRKKCYPLASKASREVADFIERKNIHSPRKLCQKFVFLSVFISV